ncbi:caprin-2-like [Argopecten irradians]|uniref:caprin-2-like n=1 Tax=Argopecten irradians TaxID=31199 RepID=UPI00371163E7
MALFWKLFVLYAIDYALCVNASIVDPSSTPCRNIDPSCKEYLLGKDDRVTELEAIMSRHDALWSNAAQRISQLERAVSEHNVVPSERDKRIEELQEKVSKHEESLVKATQRITQLEHAIHRNTQTKRSTQGVITTDLEHDDILADVDPSIHVHVDGDNDNTRLSDRRGSGDHFRTRNGPLSGRINESTVVHKPAVRVSPVESGVAFSASMSTSTTLLHVNEAIVFDSVMTNVGGGYNPHDGIFIVPESGVYVFTWTTVSISQSNIRTEIHINGVAESSLGSYGDTISNYQLATGIIVKSVIVGDHVYIKNKLDGTIVSNFQGKSTFSGWRLF